MIVVLGLSFVAIPNFLYMLRYVSMINLIAH